MTASGPSASATTPGPPVEISDLALLSNCQSAALVDGHGVIRWLCWPRFDSPPLFSDLLDPCGGLWQLGPEGPSDSSRQYLTGSLVLRTTFRTATGRAELTDALVLGPGECGHDIGMASPQLLIRHLAVTEGSLTVNGCLMPRGDFGEARPVWQQHDDHLGVQVGGNELLLDGPSPASIDDGRAFWRIGLTAGQAVTFALGTPGTGPTGPTRLEQLADTVRGWRSWSALHDGYRGACREEVLLSGRVLQGLTFAPTGAVIAAPTTSLPRQSDGGLNRDYRLVLLDHAAETTVALGVASCATEAERSVGWLLSAATPATDPPQAHLRAVFALDDAVPPALTSGADIAGWGGAGPVRLREEGWTSHTPDAVGELLASIQEVGQALGPVSARQQARLRAALAGARDAPGRAVPDRGDAAKSAVMRWVALHVAATLPGRLGGTCGTVAAAEADTAARQVCEQGWDPATGTFTAFDPTAGVEASSLLLSLCGLVAPEDPAMMRTVARVADALSARCGLLYRYEAAREVEGPSIVCTYWLVRCLAAEGRLERAEALFEQTTAYANDVGLLSEQSDPETGQLLGNFPYAPSHAALILAARDLQRARDRLSTAARTTPPR